MEKLIKR